MTPDILREHIRKCKDATDKPFGVNVPIFFRHTQETMDVILEEKVPIVFTSAGHPILWTAKLHDAGIKVAHVIANTKYAIKCEEAGVDAIVAEGFEAGGHNGKEETGTMVLIPQIRKEISIPLIAAGGIATGAGMLAAFALGAEGVQLGTRFALSQESSASNEFKTLCTQLHEGDTMLALKKITPARLVKNELYKEIEKAENRGATAEELQEIMGKGRARKGMFEGDLSNGELEIGQITSLINDIPTVESIIKNMITEYNAQMKKLYPM
jgi:enoyl-[acyl-carrier protein] reductase II